MADARAAGARAVGRWATGAPRTGHRGGPPAVWALVGVTVAAQVTYPLVSGDARDRLTVATVCLGFLAAVTHATLTRGARTGAVLVAIAAGGGLLVEAVGTATGLPFGAYRYADSLGAHVLGVPWVIPLAWTMMAWPAWLAAGRLFPGRGPARVLLAGWALAAWDLFLDPQMVAAGHWSWARGAALPGVPDVPLTNYAGWTVVAVAMAALLALALPDRPPSAADEPVHAFYLWTYASSVLAHAVFFGLPASALWGALGMGPVAVPLALSVLRDRRDRRAVAPHPLARTAR